ncbi:hypothetical protein J8M20_22980 [Pseudoalteromonas luteoviolacea]|uniref:hypothetical protein n=1 Tax=Pseudoalteromonas luteoviolacea TaxID=43657 RepID=UPI001B37454B|nr:hypothetical protein [Pseudoalteromonas luteoviolacea]MBQ4814250.1 hypothetical protein [Pseudoalteromonas luteoviolacea]
MSYYVIGSKYEKNPNDFEDMLPKMLQKSVVSVGFARGENLSGLLGESHSKIINQLKSVGESPSSCTALKHFLSLKPGDLIAVKIHGAPNGKQARLLIGAYAVVKGDITPNYNTCEELGHTIEVDFIESELSYLVNASYGQTMHHIVDSTKVAQIFGLYSTFGNSTTPIELDSPEHKNTDEIEVKASSAYIRKQVHNRIQNALLDELVSQFGKSKVEKEVDYIDVLVELEDKYLIYEVKSSPSPEACIREALGQIMHYGYQKRNRKRVEYIVVGMGSVDNSKDSYYSYIKGSISETFSYKQVEIKLTEEV